MGLAVSVGWVLAVLGWHFGAAAATRPLRSRPVLALSSLACLRRPKTAERAVIDVVGMPVLPGWLRTTGRSSWTTTTQTAATAITWKCGRRFTLPAGCPPGWPPKARNPAPLSQHLSLRNPKQSKSRVSAPPAEARGSSAPPWSAQPGATARALSRTALAPPHSRRPSPGVAGACPREASTESPKQPAPPSPSRSPSARGPKPSTRRPSPTTRSMGQST